MGSVFVEEEARRAVLTERALACTDADELERLVELAASVFQVSCTAVSVTDGAHQRIIASSAPQQRMLGELELAMNRAAACGTERKPDDLSQETPSCRPGFVRCLPLKCGTHLLGCFGIADETPRQFSSRGAAVMEMFAGVMLDQIYLVCVARKLSELGRKRLEEVFATAAENRALRRRIGQTAKLAGIRSWVFDAGSDQILWRDDAPVEVGDSAPTLLRDIFQRAERSSLNFLKRALHRAVENGGPVEVEHPMRLPGGETCWLRIVGEREPSESRPGRVAGIVQDVSERYRADEKITYLSQCDPLTGLPNRAAFQDRLQAAVRWVGRERSRAAVLVLDIDGFAEFNDASGYSGGDEALARLAQRLSGVLRACDSVARLAGDRFGVAMIGVEAAGDVMKLAERLLQAAEEALAEDPTVAGMTSSVGIALFPADGTAASQLLRCAEIALDRAKASGGGTYAFFTAEMATAAERRRQLMTDVRAGLQADQFVVAYQPKIDLRSNQLAGFEALIRWAHPERGLLSPAAFGEALDDPVLGKQLSDAVLAKVVRQLAHWRQASIEVGPVAVNVAAGQLRDAGFLDEIRTLLDRSSLPPSALRLEITEGVLLGRRSDRTIRALKGIHEIGIETELDDFGTGYASLTHLRQFPVNRLKIDKSFVTDLASPQNEAIVRAVIEMTHGLHMEVIAEGVETPETDWRLRELGCDYGQGFYYSRPIKAENVAHFVCEWQQAVKQPNSLRAVK
ncbi:MAG TPA: EAL domain-containing protein [Afifellaceae bacterium]|nr:EAL domain-containing protein [Afifellaceae bacterium]